MRSQEYEWEMEGEWEYEGESEAFFGRLAGLARRAVHSPALQRVARTAAQRAMQGGLSALRTGNVGDIATHLLGGLGEYEDEYEMEGEYENEAMLNPARRVYTDAMMEHFGHAAASAESEAEAEAFLGALVPLAARLIPRVAPAVMRAAPALIRGVANVGRTLLRNPAVRPLVRAVPSIVRGTVADIAGQVSRGQPLTGRDAVRTLARNTQRVLASPQRVVRAYQRSRAADRRFHQQQATGGGMRPAMAAPAMGGMPMSGAAPGSGCTCGQGCSCGQ